MKKEMRISRIVSCKYWKMFIFLLLISLVSIGCSDDGGNGGPTTPMTANMIPTPGSWAGEDISFTVSEDSASISNSSVTYSGHASGTRCSFDYRESTNITSSFPINAGSFSLSLPFVTIAGTLLM